MGTFFEAYVTCALWASTDEGGIPLDGHYSAADIEPESLARMRADCDAFQAAHAALLEQQTDAQGGHDLWLTRNRHGAGYWDGVWGEVGDALTGVAQALGECNLYVGDDGALYLCGGV